MAQATKDELRRERLREYDAALTAARSPVAVLALFAKGREARAGGELLEEAFAATAVEGVDPADTLPAAAWVGLRQGDVEATIELLLRMSRIEFVLAAHEELDAGYRLTKVEERRALPDVELLAAQLAAFLRIPRDVVAIISAWGADDPRTAAEVETLLEQRFGSPTRGRTGLRTAGANFRPAAADFGRASTDFGTAGAEPELSEAGLAEPGSPPLGTAEPGLAGPETAEPELPGLEIPGLAIAGTGSPMLRMSRSEFSALLNLSPQQRAVLGTLVRQTEITIAADG